MTDYREKLKKVAAKVPEVLLPKAGVDLTKFACVACDQYSAEPDYWERVEDFVGMEPSTLNMMMPEAWLGYETDHQDNIPEKMEEYLDEGILESAGEGMVFLHRKTTSGVRRGLVMALDLEEYDFTPGSKSMIRATEKTVVERLPVRIAIRRTVPLEMPHIMVLIEDKANCLMGMLDEKAASGKLGAKLYDFELMENSGHLEGWMVNAADDLNDVSDVLVSLKESAIDGMLYAMGDGNHSFAAAKAYWEEVKAELVKNGATEDDLYNHPARFGLVEIVNLYDEALEFEPIHRLLMGVDPEKVQAELGFDANNPPSLQELQPKLDAWLKNHLEVELEYIHGEDTCKKLGEKPKHLAICWKEFPKDSLFKDVAEHGVLVRKSFSMGAAPDKRFYLETRRIK